MIKHLRLHNFKTFLNFEIDLSRRHLLIGKNNSGKTNFCDALSFVCAASSHEYGKIVVRGGTDWFRHKPGYGDLTTEFKCNCELPVLGQELTYEYQLSVEVKSPNMTSQGPSSGYKTVSEQLSVSGGKLNQVCLLESDGTHARIHPLPPKGPTRQAAFDFAIQQEAPSPSDSSLLAKITDPLAHQYIAHFRQFLGSIWYYALSPPLMRHTTVFAEQLQPHVSRGVLLTHGENLSQVLFHLKNEDEPAYRRIVRLTSLLEPEIDSFNFYVTPDNKPVPYVILTNGDMAAWDSLSDGTLRLLGLATIFVQAERKEDSKNAGLPACVLIEEPENGLYRGLIHGLWEEFASIAPRSQFIFTTHSPYFIDLFDRDLESVTRLKKDGRVTTAKPLSEYRETIESKLGEFSLGELHYKEVFE